MKIYLLILTLVLFSCGGGDNRDRDRSLSFDIGDIELYVIGMSTIEATTLLGRVSVDAFLASELNTFSAVTFPCSPTGERLLIFNDLDSNFSASVGDSIRVSNMNCQDPTFDGVINGEIVIEVLSLFDGGTGSPREIEFNVSFESFRVSDLGQDVIVNGEFEIIFVDNRDGTDEIAVLFPNEGFSYGSLSSGLLEVREGGLIRAVYDFNSGAYRFLFEMVLGASYDGESFNLFLDSLGDLPGQLGEFLGDFGGFPSNGVARFFVPQIGSQCLLTPGDDDRGVAVPSSPATRYSSSGDNCVLDSTTRLRVPWSNIIDGNLFEDNDVFDLR